MCFDAHSDLLWDVERRRTEGETRVLEQHHLARLRAGGVDGLTLAVWASGTDSASYAARSERIFSAAEDEFRECPWLEIVHDTSEARAARAAGKLYAFMAVEGMAAVGSDLSVIDHYASHGVRMAMLTWNEENALATGAGGAASNGLTALGKKALLRMQARNILVDVSHLNEGGFWDVMRQTDGPVIASHSNSRSLCDMPRNLTDAQLRAIRDTGGVAGLNSYHRFVHPAPERQTAQMLAIHAAHMAEIMGAAYVGCGFDFCHFMGDSSVDGLEDCGQIPNFVYWLQQVGFNAQERLGILQDNFLRVLA